MFDFVHEFALLLVLGAGINGPRSVSAAPERRATIFYTGAVHGTLEPCGCTSDPLGDVARMTGVVRRAREAGAAVLVVDAGNLTYPGDEIPAKKREAADLKAAFLAREMTKLPFGGSAIAAADLARGPDRVVPKRLAANIARAPFVEAGRVHDVGGVKIGVFGIVDPVVARAHGIEVEDPVTAARREGERLRRDGAELVVCLAPLARPQARQIARAAPVDFVVMGKSPGNGLARAEQVGQAYLIAPAMELQKVGRLDLVLREGSGAARVTLADGGGGEALRARHEELDRNLRELEAALDRWAKDPTADRAFVKQKEKERDELRAERERLANGGWRAPTNGSYFTNRLIPLRRALPRDPAIAAAMRKLDVAVGKANLAHAAPPPKADPGRAFFVGDGKCVSCHEKETAFWKTTVHARAWKTLVDGKKTGHDDCVSCHVTGYGEIGGSSLGFTGRLENVQCETCHGAGSLHVAKEGLEDPPAVHLKTPESTCLRCHNEKHSDTFQYAAYLRDMLGPGHGEEARKKLGPGPTGHQLRTAAIAKAKATGEAQAKKM